MGWLLGPLLLNFLEQTRSSAGAAALGRTWAALALLDQGEGGHGLPDRNKTSMLCGTQLS